MTVRRKFSPEFKSEAVRQATQAGSSVAVVAGDLGVHESILRRWIKDAALGSKRQPAAGGDAVELAKEVAKLRKENARLKMERDIIKKALGYFAHDPQ